MYWHAIAIPQIEMKSLMGLKLGIVASLRYVPVCSKVFDSQQAVWLLLILCMKEKPSITQSQLCRRCVESRQAAESNFKRAPAVHVVITTAVMTKAVIPKATASLYPWAQVTLYSVHVAALVATEMPL